MKHLEANIVSDSKSDELIDTYQISVKAFKSRQDKILMPVVINKANIQMEFDPGAGASIISKKTFESSVSSVYYVIICFQRIQVTNWLFSMLYCFWR